MAILATRRKWLVTSLCAASRSLCSRQRLASMNSSCGSSIGNRLISSRYRESPVSPDKMGSAAVWAILAPSLFVPPRCGGRMGRRSDEPAAPVHVFAPATYTVESGERKGTNITSARCCVDFGASLWNSHEIGESLLIARLYSATGPTAGERTTQTGKLGRQFRPECKHFAAGWVFDR